MSAFDLPGSLRRIRRIADFSQRDLAAAAGISASTVGEAESGSRDLPVSLLVRLAALGGLRLALLDGTGHEVVPMAAGAARDRANRRFPAHLDTRYGDEDWWHGDERYAREQPWYTFDRLRYTRDYWRGRAGTPDDHLVPTPEDSPWARKEARRRAARNLQEEERARRRAAGEVRSAPEWICTCPPACEDLDDRSGKPVHADECPCRCDVG
jgi:transcriptional regulator with XRE-family HTH domain